MPWTFVFNPIAIPQLLIAIFLLAQGIIVLVQNRHSGFNRSFFLFEFAVFVWLFGMGLSYMSGDEATAFLFARIGFLGVTFIPITTYIFSVYYAGDDRQKIPAFIGLGATCIYSFFVGTPIFASGVYLYSWGYYIKLGPLGASALLLFLFFVPLFVRNFYLRYVSAPPHQKRWHLLALITGGLAFFAATDFLPSLGVSLPFPPLGFLFVGSLATLMGYFILRYRLIDVKIIAGRTVGYLLLTLILLFVYGSLFSLISLSEATADHLFLNAVFFIIALYGFTPLKEKSQRIVDELFAKEQIDFDKNVNNFTVDLRNLSDTKTLINELFNFLTEKIRLEDSAIFIFEPNAKRWAAYHSSSYAELGKPEYKDAELKAGDGQFIVRNPIPIDARGFANSSVMADPIINEGVKFLRDVNGLVAFPIIHRDLFLGFLIAGGRLSKKDFSKEEIGSLARLTASLAIAWENARAYDALIVSNKSRNDFVTIISHQLRTPLTNIKWITESLLADSEHISAEAKKFIKRINSSVEAMVSLIGQLLNAIHDAREKPGVFIEVKELVAVVESVIEEYEPIMNRKGIRLSRLFSEDLKPVYANKEYLQIVLATLIDNAIRYTGEKGSIKLSVIAKDGNMVKFEVSDSGIGIPEKEQARMFEKFFRADNAIRMVPDGTGLGLYYAKTLVESQGGTIWFRSIAGNGSTFYFTIPAA